MGKTALITGITGQDGSYLAEFFIGKGYDVHGIIRRSSSFNTERIEHLYIEEHIRDLHSQRKVTLHYGDMADACVHIMERVDFKDTYDSSQKEVRNTHINIGTGKEISIKELAETIQEIVGFRGALYFNTSKPDGTMRKCTDITRLLQYKWNEKIERKEGIKKLKSSL